MNKNKSYITGIIGALIGGFIATIPWILVYVYGNYLLSLLAIIIGMGALKGYQLLNGKVDKRLPIIITVVSIICVTVATFIIIPILLLLKEGFSITDFSWIYNNSEFKSGIIKDYIVSIVFTFLGISGVISSIKSQIREGKDTINVTFQNEENKEEIEKIKNVCIRHDATSKVSTIKEEILINELNDPFAKAMINRAVSLGYLKKYKKEYYYSDAKQTNKKTITAIITLAIFVFILCLVPIFLEDDSSNNNYTNNDTNNEENLKDEVISSAHFTFTLDKDWQENEEYREKEGRYYVRRNDLEGNRGYIYIATYSIEDTDMNEQEFIDYMIDYYKNENAEVGYLSNDSYEVNGKKIYELIWSYEDEYGMSYETVYITFNNNNYIMLDNIHYTEKISKEQKRVNTKILETLKWK